MNPKFDPPPHPGIHTPWLRHPPPPTPRYSHTMTTLPSPRYSHTMTTTPPPRYTQTMTTTPPPPRYTQTMTTTPHPGIHTPWLPRPHPGIHTPWQPPPPPRYSHTLTTTPSPWYSHTLITTLPPRYSHTLTTTPSLVPHRVHPPPQYHTHPDWMYRIDEWDRFRVDTPHFFFMVPFSWSANGDFSGYCLCCFMPSVGIKSLGIQAFLVDRPMLGAINPRLIFGEWSVAAELLVRSGSNVRQVLIVSPSDYIEVISCIYGIKTSPVPVTWALWMGLRHRRSADLCSNDI